jgi:hypothetical protein
MILDGWGQTGGEWKYFTADDMAPRDLERQLQLAQLAVEVFRNGDWRAASIRAIPLFEQTSKLEIAHLREQAKQLRGPAEKAYRDMGEKLEGALVAVKEAEAFVREQRERVNAAELRLKEATAKAKAMEREAESLQRHLDKRLALHDASTSPKTPETVTA